MSVTGAQLPGVLGQYTNDYRGGDYLRFLVGAASSEGVGESIAACARFLGCGREHARTVSTNLHVHGLVRLVWAADRQEYLHVVTDAGHDLLAEVIRCDHCGEHECGLRCDYCGAETVDAAARIPSPQPPNQGGAVGITGVPKGVQDDDVTIVDCDAALHRLAVDLGRVNAADRLLLMDEVNAWLDRRWALAMVEGLDRPAGR